MLGSLILYLKGMRIVMFQLSGFYYMFSQMSGFGLYVCSWSGWELALGGHWDIDPLSKVPFKRARSRVKKGPL